MGNLFSSQISHLAASHLKFFAQWFELLAIEEKYFRTKETAPPWLSAASDR